MRLKPVLHTFLTSFLALTVAAMLVNATYIGDLSEVYVYPPFGEASYIVGRWSATQYYAKNCSSGQIEFSGTGASTVIQNVFDTIDSIGGRVLFKTGVYELDPDSTSNFYSIFLDLRGGEGNVGLFGEEGAVLSLDCPTYGDRCSLLWIGGGSDIRISGLTFDCHDSNVVQVIYSGAYEATHKLTVDHCEFINGVFPNASHFYSPYGISSHGGQNHIYSNNRFYDFALPINVVAGKADEVGHIISDNQMYNVADVGIVLENSAANATDKITDVTISGNTIIVGSAWAYPTQHMTAGINVNLDSATYDHNIVIFGNTIRGIEANKTIGAAGIHLQYGDLPSTPPFSCISVMGNTIVNCTTDYNNEFGGIGLKSISGIRVVGNTVLNGTNGIIETGDSNYNVVSSDTHGNSETEITLVGTDSKAYSCWNGTSWIS